MSSDGFFDDDFDSALIAEVDAVTAAYLNHAPPPLHTPAPAPAISAPRFKPVTDRAPPTPPRQATPTVIEIPDSDNYDVSGAFNDDDLLEFDVAASAAYNRSTSTSSAVQSTRSLGRTRSKPRLQLDLFGNSVTANTSSSRALASPAVHRGGGGQRGGNSFGGPQRKTKYWDHTALAKSGWKFTKSKGKGKGKSRDEGEEDEEDEGEDGGRQLAAPFVPRTHLL
jgi:ATP-dependent DNA helicase MPH1